MKADTYELLIVGGGPGGLTAGIYAARSGRAAAVLDEGATGGTAAVSPWIENYPGFKGISGMDLMQKMKEHAEENIPIEMGVHIDSVSVSEEGFTLIAGDRSFQASAVILATGAKYRKLGVVGEEELTGRGGSYCATCDGPFFKDKKVLVVGGGNSAVAEAIHLRNIGMDVSLVHRRDTLRAEKSLQEQAIKEHVELILNSTAEKIKGKDKVEGAEIRNTITGELTSLDVDGVFVSVGEDPNTALAKQLGITLDQNGYIVTDRAQRTNVKMAYAIGDVTGGLKQVITACAEGAIVATSAFEDLKTPYWSKK